MITLADRKQKPKRRLDPGLGLHDKPTLMGLHNRAADRQPHAHPAGTRAEVRVKNSTQSLGRNALSVVAHRELDAAVARPSGSI